MAIPNTTPTPNELYNGEMRKMGDTELRIVLIVTRSTLGWQVDKKTGMRKQEDWISYYQLKERSGRGYTSIAKAIDVCIKNGWIEARDSEGNILDSKNKRIGKKIYYRLGRIFLDKIETSSESEEDSPTSSESEITESEISECEAYKRNTNTEIKTIQNISSNEENVFSYKEELEKLRSSKRKDYKIIADYLTIKGFQFDNKDQYIAHFKRCLGSAKHLKGYSQSQIDRIIQHCKDTYPEWTMETMVKRSADVINKI